MLPNPERPLAKCLFALCLSHTRALDELERTALYSTPEYKATGAIFHRCGKQLTVRSFLSLLVSVILLVFNLNGKGINTLQLETGPHIGKQMENQNLK
jgi:hypothetical protein